MDECTLRLSCLQLVTGYFVDADEDEILSIAKKFSDFMLTGKIEDEPAKDA